MYSIEQFPPEADLETVPVLKKLNSAHRYLAELKGICRSIPNQGILINTLSLQEAKDSSEIENIITTHDELFRAGISASQSSPAIKEVQNYASALHCGFDLIQEHGMLTNNHILTIQAELEKNRAGFRKQSGTMLRNDRTGETPRFGYTEYGDLETVTDALGHTTRHHYDAAGNPVRTDYPDGSHETFEYDRLNRLTAYIDGLGAKTAYELANAKQI